LAFCVEKKGEDYGYGKYNESVDTYIVGRKTYETVLKLTGGIFPPAQKHECYVISRQNRENENGVTFFSGDLEQLVSELKLKDGKHIYCDGGGEIVKLLTDKNLIDEYIISVIPIILGRGKRLFSGDTKMIPLKTLSAKQYETGLIQLHYIRQ